MKILTDYWRLGFRAKLRAAQRQLVAAEVQLKTLEKKFQILNEKGGNGIIIMTAEGTINYIASSVLNILGYIEADFLNRNVRLLIHENSIAYFERAIEAIKSSPDDDAVIESLMMPHADGSWRTIEATLRDLTNDESIGGIVINFRDITSHRITSDKLLYVNRLYSFISQINQSIVHAKDERELFEHACRIALEPGLFRFAWIGLVDSDLRRIEMIASAGATQKDFDYFYNYTYDQHGPIDNVVNGQDFFVVSDIENKSNNKFIVYAHERGFKSAICLPLKKSGVVVGSFNLYSGDKHFFNPQEIALLIEATSDLSFALDVFENDKQRTLAEQRLRHSEYRLKQAQEIAHLGSWQLHFRTGIQHWSEEALHIYGLPLSDSVQTLDQWLSYVHPDDLEYVLEMTTLDKFQENSVAFFHRIIRPDNQVRYLYCHALIEKNERGKPFELQGIVHDVTDAKLTETALVESKSNLRKIVDTIPQAIFAKDSDGKIVFANKSFAAILGLKPKQLIHKKVLDLSGGKQVAKLFGESMQTKASIIPEIEIQDSTGTTRIFSTTNVPYTIPGKSTQALLAIATDITQQKHTEDERTKMVSDIVQRNKDLEQFSYIVSHNLRAPVANIIGLSTELEDKDYPEDVREILQMQLSKSVRRLDEVITDLNRILQLKTEIIEEKEEVHLGGLISDIQSSLSRLIAEEQVAFKTDLGIEKLHTLKSYQHSIFYNLISNSIKYRRPDAPPVVEIRTLKTAKGTRITFKDNGIGIDLNKQNQIFGLYKRFHHHVEGKGVGLFMVKTQVEALGGRISVNSAIDSGTEFIIDYDG